MKKLAQLFITVLLVAQFNTPAMAISTDDTSLADVVVAEVKPDNTPESSETGLRQNFMKHLNSAALYKTQTIQRYKELNQMQKNCGKDVACVLGVIDGEIDIIGEIASNADALAKSFKALAHQSILMSEEARVKVAKKAQALIDGDLSELKKNALLLKELKARLEANPDSLTNEAYVELNKLQESVNTYQHVIYNTYIQLQYQHKNGQELLAIAKHAERHAAHQATLHNSARYRERRLDSTRSVYSSILSSGYVKIDPNLLKSAGRASLPIMDNRLPELPKASISIPAPSSLSFEGQSEEMFDIHSLESGIQAIVSSNVNNSASSLNETKVIDSSEKNQ